MPQIVVGKQNTIAQTWSVAGTTGTLTLTGETAWDWGLNDLLRIEDVTTSTSFGLNAGATLAFSYVAGLPQWVWTLPNLPAGTATGDTILVYMKVNPQQLETALLQYQKA